MDTHDAGLRDPENVRGQEGQSGKRLAADGLRAAGSLALYAVTLIVSAAGAAWPEFDFPFFLGSMPEAQAGRPPQRTLTSSTLVETAWFLRGVEPGRLEAPLAGEPGLIEVG